jgi:hypothetical protein
VCVPTNFFLDIKMAGKKTPNEIMSASRLPALMGLSKYRSPNDELLYTLDSLRGNELPDLIDSEPAEWGNTLEPVIMQEACMRLGLKLPKVDHDEAVFHPDWPLAASLDGSVNGQGITITTDPDAGVFVIGADSITLDGVGVLEAKLTSMQPEDSPPLWRGPIQLQAQMACANAKWGAICTLYQGIRMRVFLFAPHEATLEAIREVVYEFDRRVAMWKADGTIEYYAPQDSEDANRMWPQAVADEVTLDDLANTWAQEIMEAKQDIKDAEAVIVDREKKIKIQMKESSNAVVGQYKIAWPMRHYKAAASRVVPAKEAYSIRQSTLTIKEST